MKIVEDPPPTWIQSGLECLKHRLMSFKSALTSAWTLQSTDRSCDSTNGKYKVCKFYARSIERLNHSNVSEYINQRFPKRHAWIPHFTSCPESKIAKPGSAWSCLSSPVQKCWQNRDAKCRTSKVGKEFWTLPPGHDFSKGPGNESDSVMIGPMYANVHSKNCWD